MRYLALTVALAGIFLLFYIMFLPARDIQTLDEASVRERVRIRGLVEKERGISTGTLLVINNISVRCDCFGTYRGRFVIVDGYVDEFRRERFIRAQSIRTIPRSNSGS